MNRQTNKRQANMYVNTNIFSYSDLRRKQTYEIKSERNKIKNYRLFQTALIGNESLMGTVCV